MDKIFIVIANSRGGSLGSAAGVISPVKSLGGSVDGLFWEYHLEFDCSYLRIVSLLFFTSTFQCLLFFMYYRLTKASLSSAHHRKQISRGRLEASFSWRARNHSRKKRSKKIFSYMCITSLRSRPAVQTCRRPLYCPLNGAF